MKIGVVSDTHVPDRARLLNPAVLRVFRQERVDIILHAGDVSSPRVLDELGQLAPVRAVRGNRDWVLMRRLPAVLEFTFEGAKVVLTHGHGRWWNYVYDRTKFILAGYQLDMFQPRLLKAFPQADVIVFGHTHIPVNHRVGKQLVFNPGSAHFPEKNLAPSVGLLTFRPGGEVEGRIIPLVGEEA
jgi:putative phosphoesterase